MSPEMLNAVADYMSSTEQFRSVTSRKIASLQDSNKELSDEKSIIADSLGALVAKMASTGIIDDIHASHLESLVKGSKIAEGVNKLSALLEHNASQKVATAPQLYTVEETSNNRNLDNDSEIERSWMSRLNSLGSKA